MALKKSKNQKVNDEHLQQLLDLFPRGDPEYFQSCMKHYDENPVERIAEKIVTELGGQYPQIPFPQESHDNRLNACLRILALDLFPSCDIGFLREQVLQQHYAHIESVVEVLVSMAQLPERLAYGKMDPSEGIRSKKYKQQAQLQLVREFPQVWKSSIRAVLAENNWDYIKSFDQLKEMGSVGFWTTLRNFFVHWSSHSSSSSSSSSVTTHDFTDYHLAKQLRQIEQRTLDIQIQNDHTLAHEINLDEYTDHDQLITCDCCYGDCTFEQLSFCSEGGHAFCHDCIRRYMSEGLFGQGALRGQSRINCISSIDNCPGCLSTRMLQQVLTEDIWKAYAQSLLEDYCRGVQRVQCCCCPYFELDESTRPLEATVLRASGMIRILARWMMVVELIVLVLLLIRQQVFTFAFIITLLPFQWMHFDQWDMESDLETAYARIVKTRRGVMFTCRNSQCRTVTCLECNRPVRGAHKCWEKETDGLRLYVEKAMADAVKRTCPNCSLSFQKSDGCNKIKCRCGYTMCYVCRKEIGKESYAHFCDHFRERPGSKCTKCIRCDLYKTAPENEAVQIAAIKARDQYLQAHPEVVPSNIAIGPKSTFDKLVEWKQESVVWILERGLDLMV